MSEILEFSPERYGYGSPIYHPSSYFHTPESPETVIARQNAGTASRVLMKLSDNLLSKDLFNSAESIAKEYLNCLSKMNSPSLEKSKGLEVKMRKNIRKGKFKIKIRF